MSSQVFGSTYLVTENFRYSWTKNLLMDELSGLWFLRPLFLYHLFAYSNNLPDDVLCKIDTYTKMWSRFRCVGSLRLFLNHDLNSDTNYLGNKAKGRISKYRYQENKNFPKNEHFLPLETNTYVWGSKKCLPFRNIWVLCFLVMSVLKFVFLPYYRRIIWIRNG